MCFDKNLRTIDPDIWLDEGEGEDIHHTIIRLKEPKDILRTSQIQIIPDDPEEIAAREGIHERIQAEIHQGNKEVEARAEEMLEVPPEWNKVPDLMMEEEDVLSEATGSTKGRRDENSQGPRKRRKEDNIQPEKQGHPPTVSRRIQNPEGFYSEDWDKDQQKEENWHTPDKWQKISQMVFHNTVLETHPVGDKAISSLHTQHQGGGCSVSTEKVRDI